ncbi:hypothetical protein [Photobacterium leiognathi]|uniref:hypothetical protein n=1 Tax=Photobacterium leiognathi TaxID=553611 RepID=UPI000D1656AF|nr:hypothetical protein [Photobacterium leiognathi]PSW53037.1 hypothetical protein C0W50_19710 [Photobacterium leiognathi subsp. mandapamensis]
MDDNKRKAAAERKRKQREREKAMDIKTVSVKLSSREREQLANLCRVRAGIKDPYDVDEYIALLIARDHERLQQQLAELDGKCCGKCKSPLPTGCGGLFQGEAVCFHHISKKELAL